MQFVRYAPLVVLVLIVLTLVSIAWIKNVINADKRNKKASVGCVVTPIPKQQPSESNDESAQRASSSDEATEPAKPPEQPAPAPQPAKSGRNWGTLVFLLLAVAGITVAIWWYWDAMWGFVTSVSLERPTASGNPIVVDTSSPDWFTFQNVLIALAMFLFVMFAINGATKHGKDGTKWFARAVGAPILAFGFIFFAMLLFMGPQKAVEAVTYYWHNDLPVSGPNNKPIVRTGVPIGAPQVQEAYPGTLYVIPAHNSLLVEWRDNASVPCGSTNVPSELLQTRSVSRYDTRDGIVLESSLDYDIEVMVWFHPKVRGSCEVAMRQFDAEGRFI